MRILALDLAGQTGFARWDTSMPQPSWGTLRLPTGTQGICYASFRDALLVKISADKIEHIVVESVFVGENVSGLERLYGLMAIMREIAHRKNIPVHQVTVTEWRTPFIGQARAPKHLTKPAQRRAWLKAETRKECESRSWSVKTDDEADALGLLVFERARLFPEWGAEGSLFGYGPQVAA